MTPTLPNQPDPLWLASQEKGALMVYPFLSSNSQLHFGELPASPEEAQTIEPQW